jgi:hypothetical protein
MLQTTGKDYYDIPDDELPSANFAARPTSGISELGLLDIDGLWTFTSFASSSSENTDSESEIDDGPTPTALTQEIPLMPQPKLPQTPPDTPAITVTSPSRRQSLRQRLRSFSDVASIVRKPSMRQKSDTAPPGAKFNPADFAPQGPKRAMSARLEQRDAARGRHSRHLSSESDLKAKKVLGMPQTLLEEERPNPRFSFERGSDSWDEDEHVMSHMRASFSRKPRVRETLKRKQLTRLRMDFVEVEPDEFGDSPQSMLGTPVELYPSLESQRRPERFRPTSAINGKRGTSTPVSPKTPLPFRKSSLPSNDRSVGDEDLDNVFRTRLYVPGPIQLEMHPALLRKDSVATLDPFASEIDSIGRRPSDLMALEQIVVYFDDLGLNEGASDVCLDRYWLNGPQQAIRITDFDVTELEPPLTPRSQQSSKDAPSMLSRFSFSSASSSASVSQSYPQKRQLIRLRRLLLPALPGLKSPEG